MRRLAALAGTMNVLLLMACESDSYVKNRREEGPSAVIPSARGLASDREGRTAPVARETIEEALYGRGNPQALAPALTSTDNSQASTAAAALLTHYGCAAVKGPVREALIRQARIFPTPQGAILLGCLRGDEEAIEALRSFEATEVHVGWFGSPFPDWQSIRSFALAETGDSDARDALLARLEGGERELTNALLDHSVFPYVQDRDLLLALSESILDPRLVRSGGPGEGDFPNPEISVVAANAFAYRFGTQTPRNEERRPRPFTEAEKRTVYEETQRILRGLEEGERLPQKRLAGRVLP